MMRGFLGGKIMMQASLTFRGLRTVFLFAVFVTAVFVFPKTAHAQGDLSYYEACNTWIRVYGGSLYLAAETEMWDEADMYGYDWADGWDYAESVAVGYSAATIGGSSITCHGTTYIDGGPPIEPIERGPFAERHDDWYEWSDDYWYWDEPGAGPNEASWLVDAFIPYNWMPAPESVVYGYPVAMEGDDRTFGDDAGSYRTHLYVQLLNSAYNDDSISYGPEHLVGLSEDYYIATSIDMSNNISAEAKNDWEEGWPYKLGFRSTTTDGMYCDAPERLGQDFGGRTSSIRIHCEARAAYPLFAGSPDIEWQYTLTLTFSEYGVYYNLQGCHDNFPAHEVYVHGSGVLQDDPDTPISLLFCTPISTRTGNVGGH
jgi:hypothetical protein